MAEPKDGCVKPARGPLAPASDAAPAAAEEPKEEVTKMLARVGAEAPDFEANAYVEGEGLSSYKGQWIVLCFYPGDFTFV